MIILSKFSKRLENRPTYFHWHQGLFLELIDQCEYIISIWIQIDHYFSLSLKHHFFALFSHPEFDFLLINYFPMIFVLFFFRRQKYFFSNADIINEKERKAHVRCPRWGYEWITHFKSFSTICKKPSSKLGWVFYRVSRLNWPSVQW